MESFGPISRTLLDIPLYLRSLEPLFCSLITLSKKVLTAYTRVRVLSYAFEQDAHLVISSCTSGNILRVFGRTPSHQSIRFNRAIVYASERYRKRCFSSTRVFCEFESKDLCRHLLMHSQKDRRHTPAEYGSGLCRVVCVRERGRRILGWCNSLFP